jgi:hypothetical protein
VWEIVAATVIFASTPPPPLAPSDQIVNCSKVEYRQENLASCNLVDKNYGSGGPRRRGLLGLGIGGIL